MGKRLKDIVENSDDLFFINVIKPDKHNRQTWKFEMIDPRWTGKNIKDYKFKTVLLRRDNCFFLAYKCAESFSYFVDTKKSMFRNSIPKYVSGQINYQVYSNDVSITKNEPSFKITKQEMTSKKIMNFLDLCYYYKDYTAIGTGYTRDLRNLIVMDIDVDSTRVDNQIEITNLLLKFASYNALPDFYIFNKESKHIQLQWLIQDYQYKELDPNVSYNLINDLSNDPNKNKEIDWVKIEFTKMSDAGMIYRRFTMALCEIVEGRRKFGDKNYTFWKAKNPMSALYGVYNLELKMPYFENNEIKFRTQEEMMSLFSTEESRKRYFQKSHTFEEINKRLDPLMNKLMDKISTKKLEKIIDAEDVSETDKKTRKKNLGQSRNTFVLNCTSTITWELVKEMGFRCPESFTALPEPEIQKFKNKVLRKVKKKFAEENEKYNGIWPDTTNLTSYSNSEFEGTFNSSFQHAIVTFKNLSYSEDDRIKSQSSRHFKKDMKLIMVDSLRHKFEHLSREELYKEINKNLSEPIPYGTFKRYITESNRLSDEERQVLQNEYQMELNERKRQLNDAIESNKSPKLIYTYQKRYDYLQMKPGKKS